MAGRWRRHKQKPPSYWRLRICCFIEKRITGGEGGIRTPGTGLGPYNGLANRRLQPLGHLSAEVLRRLIIITKAGGLRERRTIFLAAGGFSRAAAAQGQLTGKKQLRPNQINSALPPTQLRSALVSLSPVDDARAAPAFARPAPASSRSKPSLSLGYSSLSSCRISTGMPFNSASFLANSGRRTPCVSSNLRVPS